MQQSPLSLIPTPAILERAAGNFPLRAGASIVLSHAAERSEWLAAQTVQRALRAHGVAAPIQPQRRYTSAPLSVVLAVRGRDDGVFPMVAALPDLPAWPYVDGGTDNTEGYVLTIEDDGIAVWGASPVGLTYGARTLSQLLVQAHGSVPALRIHDAPAFRYRGVMLDVSRGKVPTLTTLFRLVDVISSFKLNMLQLYVEDTFAFRKHPSIGSEWGALTPEEVVALDDYCRERCVELVPCLQSLGHQRRFL